MQRMKNFGMNTKTIFIFLMCLPEKGGISKDIFTYNDYNDDDDDNDNNSPKRGIVKIQW